MKIAPIHPFPARMAPEIAIAELGRLGPRSTVFDPMMGSGTVLRHAVELGHKAIGFDMTVSSSDEPRLGYFRVGFND